MLLRLRLRNRRRLLWDEWLGRRLRRRVGCSSFALPSVAFHFLFQDRDDVAALGTLEPDPFSSDLLISNAEKLAARLTAYIHDERSPDGPV
jgi:hypothetical protein